MIAPRPSHGEPRIYPDPLVLSRATARIIAPDELFQFFTREQAARSKISKRPFAEAYPNIYRVIVGVIAMNSDESTEKCVSSFGRHLCKCGDRKKSKLFIKKQSSKCETVLSDDETIVSDTSLSTASNISK